MPAIAAEIRSGADDSAIGSNHKVRIERLAKHPMAGRIEFANGDLTAGLADKEVMPAIATKVCARAKDGFISCK